MDVNCFAIPERAPCSETAYGDEVSRQRPLLIVSMILKAGSNFTARTACRALRHETLLPLPSSPVILSDYSLHRKDRDLLKRLCCPVFALGRVVCFVSVVWVFLRWSIPWAKAALTRVHHIRHPMRHFYGRYVGALTTYHAVALLSYLGTVSLPLRLTFPCCSPATTKNVRVSLLASRAATVAPSASTGDTAMRRLTFRDSSSCRPPLTLSSRFA